MKNINKNDELFILLKEELLLITSSKQLNTLANKVYKRLPSDNEQFLALCTQLVLSGNNRLFTLVTIWIKKKQLYRYENFKVYEHWLLHHIDNWGKCDVFCYRVLNPMIEKYPDLLKQIDTWVYSTNPYARRSTAVCLIHSSIQFSVNVPFDNVSNVCLKLMKDSHIHVQKGIGWLLKYTYLSYPDLTVKFLKANVKVMSRTAYRYALEKMPLKLKNEMMIL